MSLEGGPVDGHSVKEIGLKLTHLQVEVWKADFRCTLEPTFHSQAFLDSSYTFPAKIDTRRSGFVVLGADEG